MNDVDLMLMEEFVFRARFLGYAGVPFIISLPCLFYSLRSLARIYKTNKHMQRNRKSGHFESTENYTSLPPRSIRAGGVSGLKEPDPGAFGYRSSVLAATPASAVMSSPSFVTANEYPPSPKTTSSAAPFILASQSPSPVERKFHLPFRPPITTPETPAMDSLVEDPRKLPEEEDVSDVSSTLPTFVIPEVSANSPTAQSQRMAAKKDVVLRSRRETSTGGESDVSEIQWAHRRVESELGVEEPGIVYSKTDIRDDGSDVLGDAMSGDVTSGRYMTPMEYISQPSK